MNMAKTRKAAKKKNTPTTLANESTPRLKKDEEKIVKMRREIRQSKNAQQISVEMKREIRHYKKVSPKNRENDAWNSSKQKRQKANQTWTYLESRKLSSAEGHPDRHHFFWSSSGT